MFQRRSRWKSKRRRKTIKRTLETCWIICSGKPRPRPVYTGYHSLTSRCVKPLTPTLPPTLTTCYLPPRPSLPVFSTFVTSCSCSPNRRFSQTKVRSEININCGLLWKLSLECLATLQRGTVQSTTSVGWIFFFFQLVFRCDKLVSPQFVAELLLRNWR